MITEKFLADGAVSKYAVVSVGRFNNTCTHCFWPDPRYMNNILGLALNGGGDGAEIEVCVLGCVQDNIFNFTLYKPVYVNVGGYLSQVRPVKSVYRVGIPVANNRLFVSPSQVFLLKM